MQDRDEEFIKLVDKLLANEDVINVETISRATKKAIFTSTDFHISRERYVGIVNRKKKAKYRYPVKNERDVLLVELFNKYRKKYPKMYATDLCEIILIENKAPRFYIEESTAFRLYYRILNKNRKKR